MNKTVKIFLVAFVLLTSDFLLFAPVAKAVCPVCTAAVIGGLGLSRYLGIDDAISGVWVGGLILSLSFWLVDWIRKKGWLKKIDKESILLISIILSFYLITFIPLQITNFIGHPVNKIWGIDKLIFGSVLGSLIFLGGIFGDRKVRQIKGKQFFEFQKVVFPVSLLVITSVILYLVLK